MSEMVWIIVLWTLIFMWSIFALMTLAISSLREKHKKKPNVSAKGKIKAQKHKHEWEYINGTEFIDKNILIDLHPKRTRHSCIVWCKYCGKVNKRLTKKYERECLERAKEKENGKIVH